MSGPDNPGSTTEARQRWVQRAGDTVSLPSDYWDHAHPLDDHGLDADEARYDPVHEVVLVRKDSAIVTVLDTGANLRGATWDAIRRASATHDFAMPGGGDGS